MSERTPNGDRGLLSLVQGLLGRRESESVRDQVEALLDGEELGREPGDALEPHERVILGNVLRLRHKTAVDVMVPRADIVAMPDTLTLDGALALFQREGHSRLPVYRENLDDVRGMIHLKDVVAAVGREAPFSVEAALRPLLFTVPQIGVLDLLLQMRESRTHMALVVDEYGGVDGLVTIEDLVETIVGDISDEHDEEEAPQAVERPDGTLDLDGRMTVEAFEARFGPVLSEEERAQDIDTVAGLVFTLAGRVPARGELVSHGSGIEFRVLDSDPRRIRRLRVRRAAGPAQVLSLASPEAAKAEAPTALDAPARGSVATALPGAAAE